MDRIVATEGSTLADTIARETGAPQERTDGLRPWQISEHDRIRDLVLKRPNQRSSAGESFVQFKRRFTSDVSKLMSHHEQNPQDRTVAVVPSHGARLIEAWARKGFPRDLAIDGLHMATAGEPSEVRYLRRSAGGKWKLTTADMRNESALKPGIYVVPQL